MNSSTFTDDEDSDNRDLLPHKSSEAGLHGSLNGDLAYSHDLFQEEKPRKEYDSVLSRYRTERRRYLAREEPKGRGRPPLPQGSPSIDSLSSIPTEGGMASQNSKKSFQNESLSLSDVKEIYQEFQEINDRIKREFEILHERDMILKDKEQALNAAQSTFELTIEQEMNRRIGLKEQENKIELKKLEEQLKEKTRDNKRLKENFDTLKTVNEALRKEVETLHTHHVKLEKQHASLQARWTNLQRKQEQGEKKNGDQMPAEFAKLQNVMPAQSTSTKSSSKTKLKTTVTGQDVLAVLLEWVSEVNLKQALEKPTKSAAGKRPDGSDPIQDNCLKILPFLVELLKELPCSNVKVVLPCLQFIYWSLLHLEDIQGHQKSSMMSTFRRLGEELYRPRTSRQVMENSGLSTTDKTKDGAGFFRSQHPHIRFLSSLIIIKTISQVDHLAHVYDVLRSDLKSDAGKEIFLNYQATPVMLPHLRPSNKALCNAALDIYLQMAMESIYLRGFLETCSRESWFQIISLLWRMPGAEPKLLEKLSIILQKLSKIKSNKKYFEVYGMTTSCQEYLRTLANESAFLTLNLKSILFNLNIVK